MTSVEDGEDELEGELEDERWTAENRKLSGKLDREKLGVEQSLATSP